jgi:hypothetical protein
MNEIDTMNRFFFGLTSSLRAYNAKTVLSIDVFGEVAAYGAIKGTGQDFSSAAKYFDVVCPIAYPSHYHCGEFGLRDPNANPYAVYKSTLSPTVKTLGEEAGRKIRPWIQAFSIKNIYGCGPIIHYTPALIRDEIRAGAELGIKSFMLWNAGSNYNPKAFNSIDQSFK